MSLKCFRIVFQSSKNVYAGSQSVLLAILAREHIPVREHILGRCLLVKIQLGEYGSNNESLKSNLEC
jgi:hypothetical protein